MKTLESLKSVFSRKRPVRYEFIVPADGVVRAEPPQPDEILVANFSKEIDQYESRSRDISRDMLTLFKNIDKNPDIKDFYQTAIKNAQMMKNEYLAEKLTEVATSTPEERLRKYDVDQPSSPESYVVRLCEEVAIATANPVSHERHVPLSPTSQEIAKYYDPADIAEEKWVGGKDTAEMAYRLFGLHQHLSEDLPASLTPYSHHKSNTRELATLPVTIRLSLPEASSAPTASYIENIPYVQVTVSRV